MLNIQFPFALEVTNYFPVGSLLVPRYHFIHNILDNEGEMTPAQIVANICCSPTLVADKGNQ
jgi:hypothetical protein